MKKKINQKLVSQMSAPIRTWAWSLHKAVSPSQRRNRVLAHVAAEVAMGKPSHHSTGGTTIAAILSFLEEQKIPYILERHPEGYRIQAMPTAEDLVPEQEFPTGPLTTTH